MSNQSQQSRLSHIDKVRNFIDIVEIRRAVDQEDLDAIYRLRYEAYRRENFIRPNIEKLCIDELDDSQNHYDFGFYLNDRLLSSMRLHIVTQQEPQCATMLAFPEIVGEWLKEGKTLIDPSRFVTDLECSALYPELPLVMMRLPIMAAQYFNANYGAFTVRPEHVAFYKRIFRATEMSGYRKFPYVDFNVILMRADTSNPEQGIFKRYPYFKSDYLEQRALFRSSKSTEPSSVEFSTHIPA